MPATWVPWPKQSSELPSPKLEKPDLAREPVCVQDTQSAGCSCEISVRKSGRNDYMPCRTHWVAAQAGTTCQALRLAGIRKLKLVMIQSNALQ